MNVDTEGRAQVLIADVYFFFQVQMPAIQFHRVNGITRVLVDIFHNTIFKWDTNKKMWLFTAAVAVAKRFLRDTTKRKEKKKRSCHV